MRHSARVAALLLVGALLQACAVGNKHDVATITPQWAGKAAHEIAIAVVDQRDYVLDGDKEPDFVGLQRGGFGNPFDVTTASRRPLAEDFRQAISSALVNGGAKVVPVDAKPSATTDDAMSDLAATSAQRLVLLRIKEWKADTYTNTALHYHLLLSILGADGALLASSERTGEDDLGGSFVNPPAHAKTAVPAAFKRIIEELLGESDILAALQ